MAEQKGNQVYIEFKGGDSVNVKGNLDRGYTY